MPPKYPVELWEVTAAPSPPGPGGITKLGCDGSETLGQGTQDKGLLSPPSTKRDPAKSCPWSWGSGRVGNPKGEDEKPHFGRAQLLPWEALRAATSLLSIFGDKLLNPNH